MNGAEETLAAPLWDDKKVAEFRRKNTNIRKNFWNRVDERVSAPNGPMIVAAVITGLTIVAALLGPISIMTSNNWAGFVFISLYIIALFGGSLVQKWKIPQPKWQVCSLRELQKVWVFLTKENILLKTVHEQRLLHPDSEFEIEYYDPSGKEAFTALPRCCILWMYPCLFTAPDLRVAVLVLKDGVKQDALA